MATIANLKVDQGADFATTINLNNLDGTDFNLTGYTVASQMAKSYASTTKTTITASITDAATGAIELSLSNSQTAALAQGRYVYDVEISVKYSFNAPTAGSIDMQLSFNITSRFVFSAPA